MRHRNLFMFATITTLVTGTLAFSGCHRHRSPEERITHKLDHLAYHLDLSDQQKVKLGEVKDEMLRARQELSQDHQAVLDELLGEVRSEHLDQTKLVQLIQRHQARMLEVAPPMIEKVAELHASLTPDQKAQAVERLEWLRERMTKHGHGARM